MRRAALLVLLALGAAGCTADFDDVSTVKDLRVLAVTAEPPEILVDLKGASNQVELAAAALNLPVAFDPVSLRALVVDPQGQGRAVHFRVVACGNDPANGRERGRNEGPGNVRDTVSRQGCPANALLLAEGDAVAVKGEVPVAASFVATREFLIQAAMADPLGVALGLPVTVELTVSAGTERVIALKRVIFMPRIDAQQTPNKNPVIADLSFRRAPNQPLASVDPASPPEVALGTTLEIEPGQAEAEPYRAPALDRTTGQVKIDTVDKETIRYAFFATRGKFSPDQVSTQVSLLRTNPVVHLDTKYEAPLQLSPGESPDVDVWVVVRDERGGASFIRSALRLR